MRSSVTLLLLLPTVLDGVYASSIYKHGWETVADAMAMHGKFSSADSFPAATSVDFVAEHYGMVLGRAFGGRRRRRRICVDDTRRHRRHLTTHLPFPASLRALACPAQCHPPCCHVIHE